MKSFLFFCSILLSLNLGLAQQKPAYVLYNAKGKKIGYEKMIRILKEKDIILFGEYHNNPIAHWMQLELTMALHQNRNLILGAEMFEQDNQQALDLYLSGKISGKGLDSMARLWKNYPTDYAPLVNYARDNHLVFAATNIPRKFAAMVARGGFEALDTITIKEKTWMAPLPIAYDPELPGYKKMLAMMGGHSGVNLPKAQAIKDATMAYFILAHYATGSTFLHFNGSYHSDNYEGIGWYLKKARPDLQYATISTVSQKNILKLEAENKGKADFILCVDENMTTTY